MCGWLLVHTGWVSLAVAGGLVIIGLAVGYRRANTGADASPIGPRRRRNG